MRLHYEFSKPPIEGVHRSKSRRVSIAADFPRQINERNDDGKCADELADCTNGFPIHDMIHVIVADIQSHCAVRRKACRDRLTISGLLEDLNCTSDRALIRLAKSVCAERSATKPGSKLRP